jgi:hypothetical protein
VNFVVRLIISFFILSTITVADEFSEQRKKCNESGSHRWNPTLNRCIQTQNTVEIAEKHKNCLEKDTKEAQDDCMYNLVRQAGVQVDFEEVDMTWELTYQVAQAALTITNLGAMKEGHSSCTSLKVASGCGGAAVLKDIYIFNKAKDVIKDHENKFQEKMKENPEINAYDTQVLAYNTKADELKDIAKFYKQKASYHKVVAGCYGVVVAIAGTEALYNSNQCLMSDEAQEGLGEDGVVPDGVHSTYMSGYEGFFTTFRAYMRSPWGITVLGGMNITWNMMLASKLDEEAEKAEKAAKRMEIVRDQFTGAMATTCPDGHDDRSQPLCYCYINGSKNKNRTNSKMCRDLWASKDRNLFVRSSDKERGSQAKTKRGCININGKFDPNCECRRFKDQQGNNACKKVSLGSIQLGNFGKALNTKGLEEAMSKITQGLPTPGLGDLGDNVQKALTDDIQRQLISKVARKDDETGKKIKMTPKFVDANKAKIEKMMGKKIASLSPDKLPANLKSMSPMSANVAKSKKTVEGIGLQMEGGKGLGLKKKKKKKTDTNFSVDYSDSKNTVATFSDDRYMEKTYNTGNADINSRKDVSIFDILTNRYNKSGYRRLFEE